MKFRLVEDIDLEEEVLNEKMWVEVKSNAKGALPFYFYATDDNTQADVDTLIPLINGSQTGTYKQSVNKDILNRLKNEYKSVGNTFALNIINKNVPYTTVSVGDILTLMDRDLRKEGNATGKAGVATLTNGKNVLVHHKNGKEGDNSHPNLMVFECDDPIENILARAGHVAAHTTHNLTTGVPFTKSIKVYEHNGATFTQTHTIELNIT